MKNTMRKKKLLNLSLSFLLSSALTGPQSLFAMEDQEDNPYHATGESDASEIDYNELPFNELLEQAYNGNEKCHKCLFQQIAQGKHYTFMNQIELTRLIDLNQGDQLIDTLTNEEIFYLVATDLMTNILNSFSSEGLKQLYLKTQEQANMGIPQALHNLGIMYNTAFGVNQDTQTSITYYQQAADQGHAVAQYCLASLLLREQNDEQQALHYFEKAAQQGYPLAQHELGCMYSREGNDVQAIFWLKKAVDNEYMMSAFTLGRLFSFGMTEEEEDIQ